MSSTSMYVCSAAVKSNASSPVLWIRRSVRSSSPCRLTVNTALKACGLAAARQSVACRRRQANRRPGCDARPQGSVAAHARTAACRPPDTKQRLQGSARRACAPHGARVLVVDQHQLEGGVALVGLQVRARGRDVPHQVARKPVLLHGARPELTRARSHRVSRRWAGPTSGACACRSGRTCSPIHTTTQGCLEPEGAKRRAWGKQWGTPPLMGLTPSNWASGRM